ncbi:NUDIX domain-containing protein [Flavobacterium sp. xlx-214]|uniref:NUDIX hydrolase n=1 Tax=unclassified Flavobacterium TaxID=196869 RepID=UPI0013D10A67|nr:MULTISPECIES: NUDIX domain-containing protein [unclassified Flavobacterium]MBA5793627.1 NUDIX domain-containing protein [Flavobacterium sp. xlx-221]QMI84556.1 NUDIX domain-containing protein [Flavobacterium sp. xlx-214]
MNQVPVGLKRTATLCVLKHNNQFLLLKRLKEPNKDQYTPVGGKLDPFESPLQAAIRETFEETGIKVTTMKYCGTLTETSPTKYNWINYVYIAEIDFIEPPFCNEGTLNWIAFDDLLKVPTPKTDWFIYKYILDNKPFAFSALYNEDLDLLSMIEEIENTELA